MTDRAPSKKYSGGEVNRAGEALNTAALMEDFSYFESVMDVLSYWRYSHEAPLEEAFSLLKVVVKDKDRSAIFAKRLKRFVSIQKKLLRFEKMKLKNMQDIGGCRAIVSNKKKALKVVRELKKEAAFRGEGGRARFKDYIKNPKEDGYRGYHLVGKFPGTDGDYRNIEVQVRSRLQHDWATSLEIVDLFTGQALKSSVGDQDWKDFFANVSIHFAEMEEIHLFDVKSHAEKQALFDERTRSYDRPRTESLVLVKELAEKLNVVYRFQAFAHSLKVADGRIEEASVEGYVLLVVDMKTATITTKIYDKRDSELAEREYVEEEKVLSDDRNRVVALVSTTAVGGIKEAYPNYFADSGDFMSHLVLVLNAQEDGRRVLQVAPWR